MSSTSASTSDERASVTRRHFQAAAATYDRGRGYEKWAFWAQELDRLAGAARAGPVLGLGCGTASLPSRMSQPSAAPTCL